MFNRLWIGVLLVGVVVVTSPAFGQSQVIKVPGLFEDSQTFDFPIPIHSDRTVSHWSGFLLHVQNIDSTEISQAEINGVQIGPDATGAVGSTLVSWFNPEAPRSGAFLDISQTLSPFVLIGHVTNTDLPDVNSDADLTVDIYAIEHVFSVAPNVPWNQVVRNPSDYYIGGQNNPDTWVHHDGDTDFPWLPASAYIARLLTNIQIGVDHRPPPNGDIPEPVSFGIWGAGLLCGAIGLCMRRRRRR